MDTQTIVRWANAEDAADLTKMNEEFNECPRLEQDIRDALAAGGELVAVALLDGAHAGFACAQLQRSFCYDRPEAFITELYVREEYRRRGAATALLRFLERELVHRGADHVHLETGEGNATARRLYDRCGYRQRKVVALSKNLAQRNSGSLN